MAYLPERFFVMFDKSCISCVGDLWQRVLKEVVKFWIKLMPHYHAQSRFDLAIAWSKAKQSVCGGVSPTSLQQVPLVRIKWQNVIGLVSNVVSSLLAVGWLPLTYFEWHAPDGTIWNIPTQMNHPIHG